jgi:hypothetical protein
LPKYIQSIIILSFPITEDIKQRDLDPILAEMQKLGDGLAMMIRGQMLMKDMPGQVVIKTDIVDEENAEQVH